MQATRLSIEEYRKQHAHTKGSEYWFGEVRFKSVPTWLHSLLQGLLVQVFTEAGYASGSELELRIDPEWEPRPDVAASTVVEEPYPTKPIEIAAEILSPTDSMDEVREKCAHYERIGIRRIFVFDPGGKQAFAWRPSNLEPVEEIQFGNGTASVAVSDIWKGVRPAHCAWRYEEKIGCGFPGMDSIRNLPGGFRLMVCAPVIILKGC